MSRKKRIRELIPPWSMPSDPVKAIWWFMHWLLKVFVRFFWLPILVMMGFEALNNGSNYGFVDGLVASVVTLLVGLVVWGVLWVTLLIVNLSTGISRVIADAQRFQPRSQGYRPFSPFGNGEERKENIVEGTITDLQEERNKRRRE